MNAAFSDSMPRRSRPSWRVWLVGGLFLLLAASLAGSIWLYIWYPAVYAAHGDSTTTGLVLTVLSSTAFALIGGLIVIYRPRNPIGWLAMWQAFGLSAVFLGASYVACGAAGQLTDRLALSLLPYAAWLWYSDLFSAIVPMFVLIPMLFPTGRFLTRRWAWVTAASLGVYFVTRIAMGLLPDFSQDNSFGHSAALNNPFGLEALPDWWYPFFRNASLLVVLGLSFAAIASLVLCFRRSEGDERQQMKWLTYFLATAVVVQLLVFELAGALFYPQIFQTIWYESIVLLVFVGYPVIIGVAIFKFRLYDIDLIINHTLVYGALTAILIAVYALIVSGLGLLFHDEDNFPASLLAAGVIAVLFQPLHIRLQTAANRWLFGERDDPARLLTRLTNQLAVADSSASLLSSLVETVAVSLKLPFVALWLRQRDGQFDLAAQTGQQPNHVVTVPLMHQQDVIGRLVVAPRSPGEALSAGDHQLLTAIARLTATTARTIQLTGEVQEARVRTVSALEEERRRLRRDLHDGLGPVLASQGLKLAAARQLLREKPDVAERLLDEVMGQGENTVAEVRRLVYALRPPTLDELGLVEAIREHVETVSSTASLQIRVNTPASLPEIPAAIEVAAFRVVQEALNNVIRHAEARHCTITINFEEGLQICVQDDGLGLPADARSGVGLQSMRERAAEVGGVCRIETGAGGGVIVRLSLPLANGG